MSQSPGKGTQCDERVSDCPHGWWKAEQGSAKRWEASDSVARETSGFKIRAWGESMAHGLDGHMGKKSACGSVAFLERNSQRAASKLGFSLIERIPPLGAVVNTNK